MAGRGSSASFAPILLDIYQCVPVGLWDAPSRSDGLRGLVRERDPGTHQSAGNEVSNTVSGCLPASVVGAEYCPDERQHLGCRLSPS